MFKHIRSVSVLSLILFLAGVFCIIFSLNEINTVTAENSGNYDSAVENTGLKKIIINGSIPMEYRWDYGEEFKISVSNINPEIIKVSEEDGTLYINYEIKSKNMDQLFLPLIAYATDTKPLIKITIPEERAVSERIDTSKHYYSTFDFHRIINSRHYPDTKVELILDDASNGTIIYDDPVYYEIYPETERDRGIMKVEQYMAIQEITESDE